MVEVFIANCRSHNWDACKKETIFGLKLGRNLPPLKQGDIVLLRVTGPNYGVKAIWYFEQAIEVDENVNVPWTDAQYGWILKCRPIIELPRPFSEDFQTSSKLSTKIPNFPAGRILPSIVHLKNPETRAYLEHIFREFENNLQTTFDYLGERKTVEDFLEAVINSLPEMKLMSPVSKTISEVEMEPTEVVENLEETEVTKFVLERGGRITSFGIVGERIDLPILNYAPLNEKGVILLFGYYLQDLGFSHIEEIRSGFPDAIGMKAIGNGRYKRVRIEFEFRCSSFLRHNHPIDQCDIIVCWVNDWPDCPIEVVELKSTLFESES